jgi:hypothetical protein
VHIAQCSTCQLREASGAHVVIKHHWQPESITQAGGKWYVSPASVGRVAPDPSLRINEPEDDYAYRHRTVCGWH